jgi:hypothetical protein
MDFLSFSLGASRVGVIRVEVLRLVGIEGLSAVSFPPAISSYLLVVKGEFLSCLAQKLFLFSLEKNSLAARF